MQRGDSVTMQLRTMVKSDIAAGMRLKEIAGWNQTAEDWTRFLEASPAGCFVVEEDGAVRGTAATITYEDKFAWVGMVLVDPDYRSKGIGTRLLEKAIEYLDERKILSIKLDATPQGKPLYERLGFVSEYEIERWTLKRTVGGGDKAAAASLPEGLPAGLLESICKTDLQAFGADRSGLLKSLNKNAPGMTLGIWTAGRLDGYAFMRHGSFADHLGPWIARDVGTAAQMLDTFLGDSQRATLIVDRMKDNPFMEELLKAGGFSYSRLLTRMYRGANDFPGRPESICAIMGPEFG